MSSTGNIMNNIVTTSERFSSSSGDFVSDLTSTPTPSQIAPNSYSIISIINVILVLLVLSILGINVLGYTEIVIEKIMRFIEPIFKFFGYSIINLTDRTLENTRQGAIFTTNAIIDSSQAVISDVGDLLDVPSSSSKASSGGSIRNVHKTDEPSHDDALSEIQRGSSAKSKPGYCYIGTDRGVRSCVKVGQYDKCMSGEIFPRMDICVNPKLRT